MHMYIHRYACMCVSLQAWYVVTFCTHEKQLTDVNIRNVLVMSVKRTGIWSMDVILANMWKRQLLASWTGKCVCPG